MESTGAKCKRWRTPETSQILSSPVELTGNEVSAPKTEFGLPLARSMAWESPFLECLDMQRVMEELAGVERVCNTMIARLPRSNHPPNECISDISQAGLQENGHTKESEIPTQIHAIPSRCLPQPPVIVDLSSDGEFDEDSEVVQGIKVAVRPEPSPSSQLSPFSDVESNHLKRKADGEDNIGEDDVDYEAHIFQVPHDLLQGSDDDVDEATWNERAEVLGGIRRTDNPVTTQEIPPRKKMKAREKRRREKKRVTYMTDQVILIDSDSEKDNDKNCMVSTPTINDSLEVLNAYCSKAGFRDGKSRHLVARKNEKRETLRMPSAEIKAEKKAERLKEKERKKVLAQERREERVAKKRKLLEEKGRLFERKKEDQDIEEDDESQEGDEPPDKPAMKELEPEEEVRQITSKLYGEKVVYEPYVWRNTSEDKDDEDSELDDIWQDMATVVAVSSTTFAEPLPVRITPVPELDANDMAQVSKTCMHGKHAGIDFDEDMGYYCDNCGAVGLESPQDDMDITNDGVEHKRTCEHKNRGYKDEVGQYCLDCGLVGRDIQKTFIPEILHPVKTPARPRSIDSKEHEGKGAYSRINLKVRDADGEEDSIDDEVELHLHPYYDGKLHPHQRDGFTFLSRNLLGDKQGGSVGCILAHAPGTGKTFLMVSFIQSFLARFPEGRPIILAPKIMLKTWQDEFEKFKVEDIPIFDLNGCNPVGMIDDEEDVEVESCWSAHMKLNLKENRAKVLREWQGSRGVLVMSYTLFAILTEKGQSEKAMPESLDYQISKVLQDAPGLVVLDEGHLARTKKTKILKSLMLMRTRRRVLLSGTLFQNNFKELYTLLKLCREDFMTCRPEYARRLAELFGVSVGRNGGSSTPSGRQRSTSLQQHEENIFTREFGDILENYVRHGFSTEQETEQINSVVQSLRSLTASFVHWYPGKILESLPGLIEFSVHLNLTEVQEKVISELPSSIKYHMSRHCKVLAACIHPSLVKCEENAPNPELLLSHVPSENLEQEVFQGVKIEFIVRIAELCVKANEKLLIFSSNLVPLSYVEEVFIRKWKWARGQQFFRLDGTMSEPDRQSVISLFNNSKQPQGGVDAHVLMASIKACKEGITLVGASRVIIIDNPDNPSVVRQAVSRAFRIGQKRKVYVYRLVTNNREEEELFRRSVNKEKLSKVLLDRVGKTSTKIGDFLQELSPPEVKDELLFKLMQDDKGRTINVVRRYNAAGC